MSAPNLTISGQPSSRYVKRCVRCRVVRGNSAFFHAGRYGHSTDVCRFCTQSTIDERKAIRAKLRNIPNLRRTEQRLVVQLERVRAEIARREAAAIALEQGNLFPPL